MNALAAINAGTIIKKFQLTSNEASQFNILISQHCPDSGMNDKTGQLFVNFVRGLQGQSGKQKATNLLESKLTGRSKHTCARLLVTRCIAAKILAIEISRRPHLVFTSYENSDLKQTIDDVLEEYTCSLTDSSTRMEGNR